ncbi:hypothetical protein IKG49_00040 [Candidatus Saccharibacteria bacterium]|nr:hypothetical protein [Candidatus Saccharibacteria bacterium]
MVFFEKLEPNPYEDLKWNIPEQKQGAVNVIGGNQQNFKTEVKTTEFLAGVYPVQETWLVLPDALKKSLPNLPNFKFLPSTDTGSFAESQEMIDIFNAVDYNLVLGDFSKNSATGKALASAVKSSEKMTLVTRDTVNLLTENMPEQVLMNENLVIMASVMQLQKLLRAVYYPKMLLMTSSLMQVAEILHKFTLSYPIGIVTLHNGQILVAKDGAVKAVELAKTGYLAMSFWNGEVAAKIVGMNLYNPNRFIESAVVALFEN